VNVIGSVPLQTPVDEVSVRPTSASPLTTGIETRCGGVAVGGSDPGTSAVGADDSDDDPAAFVAVTRERIVEPTSSEVTA